jgi:hypothetical protein
MHRSLIQLSRHAPAVVISAAVAGSVLLVPTHAVAASPSLKCIASVSDSRPSSATTVIVKTAAHARVMTSALYRTTTDTQSASANSQGLAVTDYDTESATHGFRVKVTVLVQLGSRSGQCLTSYVPS